MANYIRKGIWRVFIMLYIGAQMRIINGYKKITEEQRVIISVQSNIIKENTDVREELLAFRKDLLWKETSPIECADGYTKKRCWWVDRKVEVCVKRVWNHYEPEDWIGSYWNKQCK